MEPLRSAHSRQCDAVRSAIIDAARASRAYAPSEGTDRRVCHRMLAELVRSPSGLRAQEFTAIRLHGVHIDGTLRLELTACAKALQLIDCVIAGDLLLEQATIHSAQVMFADIWGNVRARQLRCATGFWLSCVDVAGTVDLTGAAIGGDLHCEGTHVELETPAAGADMAGFVADRLRCDGSVLLASARDDGTIRRRLSAPSGVSLIGARVAGTLDLRGARLGPTPDHWREKEGPAPSRTWNVSSECICENPDVPDQRHAARVTLGTGVGQPHSEFKEPWRAPLPTAEVGLIERAAIAGDLLRCEGSVLLDELQAVGDVRLLDARVHGQLLVRRAKIHGSFRGNAMECLDVAVLREVELSGDRGVAFPGARMVQRLALVETNMSWLNLSDATVGNYVDDRRSRPPAGGLSIDGFTYGRVGDLDYPGDGYEEREFEARLEWIELQGAKTSDLKWHVLRSAYPYIPSPYTVFADFLDRRGRPRLAVKARMRREDRRATQEHLALRERIWLTFLRWTVGSGHRPHRALYWVAGSVVLYLGLDHWRETIDRSIAQEGAWSWPPYLWLAGTVNMLWCALEKIAPLPSILVKTDWPAVVLGLFVALVGTAGVAGLLQFLGKK